MKREWVGNYELHYNEYHSYKDEWVSRTTDLGRCLGVDEAIEKAMAFFAREDITPRWDKIKIVDGWGNEFTAI